MDTTLAEIFMDRDGMTEEEAREQIRSMRREVARGRNPEEVLEDEGLEPDYIFEII